MKPAKWYLWLTAIFAVLLLLSLIVLQVPGAKDKVATIVKKPAESVAMVASSVFKFSIGALLVLFGIALVSTSLVFGLIVIAAGAYFMWQAAIPWFSKTPITSE